MFHKIKTMQFAHHIVNSVFYLVIWYDIFVHCVDEAIIVTQCNTSNGSTTCRFNSKELHLDTATSIDFIAHQGKRVKCENKMTSGENVWYGSCVGDASDANFVLRKDQNGDTQVFGSVHVGSDICQISPNADGVDQIVCTPSSDFPSEDTAMEAPPVDEDSNRELQNLQSGYHPNFTDKDDNDVLVALRGNLSRSLFDDSGATIDVMVVWTKQAECKVSKLPSSCSLTSTTQSNMRGTIDLAVAETNTALQLSGILSSIRLVHAYRHPAYVEPMSNTFVASLSDLQGIGDGKLDDVHVKRALYGADLVQMLISTFPDWSNVCELHRPRLVSLTMYRFV